MKLFSILALLLGCHLWSSEPVCHKCEVIREYNKDHPGDYEYYDDYMEAQKKEEALKEANSKKETKSGLPS